MLSVSRTWSLVKDSFAEWSQDNVSRLAAALAYYTVFSLAPMLVIVIAALGQVANRIWGPGTAKREVTRQIQGLMGPDAANFIGNMVDKAGQHGSGWAMIVGVVILLYAATNVFASLQDSLNTIWEVKARPGLGIVQTLRNRLLSFAMVLGIAFLLMVSLVISAVLSATTSYIAGGEVPSLLLRTVEQVVSLGVYTVIIAAIYKVLPDVKIGWRSVWVGALITAVLFTIGKYLIGLYLGRSSVTSVYGAAGSLVIVLLWIYYASQILFFGAEFTQVYSRRAGMKVAPAEHAVKLTERERVQQGMPHQETIDHSLAAADAKRDLPSAHRTTPITGVTYMAAAAGLVAGFAAGGLGKFLHGRDTALRQAAAQRTRERIRLVHARLKQGEHLAAYLRESDAHDRLDLLERRLRRVSRSVG